MIRSYGFPAYLEKGSEKALQSYGLTLQDSKSLAEAVLRLSDFFIQNPDGTTPWKEKWAQVAYLCYFLPLNSIRLQGIQDQTRHLGFWQNIEHVYDFGAGLATASQVLAQQSEQILNFHLIEQGLEPEKIITSFFSDFKAASWNTGINASSIRDPKKSVALFSYSLTELDKIPDWALQCEGLFIIEPSTSEDSRRLLQFREELMGQNYSAWAPCTHQDLCPLLHQSKHDWCHDRVHFNAPAWFAKMEQHLPMKNRTLTMSYLMMRKTPAKKIQAARVVGDQLKEKGKDRQLICQGPEREFLTWMHKEKIEQEIPRGVLIEIPSGTVKVANELRVKQAVLVL